ncbi:MAG: hypothetical protein R3208_21330 [Ketobacteraceae bacterium]|nr:hypothetical protein [Ketobacteraceae bacterium]
MLVSNPDGQQCSVDQFVFRGCGRGEWGAALREYVKANNLKQLETHIVFHPDFYELMLIDAPEVPDEELNEAVKWRVKDFISSSIENYVVEAFRLPSDAYRGRMNMIYVAFMKKDAVRDIVALCEELDLELVDIGISELARAALTQSDELNDLGVAFLHLGEKQGQIDLYENGHLYLSRGIDTGYSMLNRGAPTEGGLSLDNSDQLDGLALDVQRSLDYYESQLGKSGVSRLFLLTPEIIAEDTCESLSQILPVKVTPYDLRERYSCDADCSSHMDSCSIALGAVLGGTDGRA